MAYRMKSIFGLPVSFGESYFEINRKWKESITSTKKEIDDVNQINVVASKKYIQIPDKKSINKSKSNT